MPLSSVFVLDPVLRLDPPMAAAAAVLRIDEVGAPVEKR